MKNDQSIMVIERSELFRGDSFQGFKPHKDVDFESRILNHRHFLKRSEAETNVNFKQPVAYVVITSPKQKKIFLYRRASKVEKYQEKRLQGKWSIGIGGHIEKIDNKTANPIQSSLMREISEEIKIKGKQKLKILGYINDDSNAVGKVHFGILYVIEVDGKVKPNSKEIETGLLVSYEEIDEMMKNKDFEMEGWSQIALSALK